MPGFREQLISMMPHQVYKFTRLIYVNLKKFSYLTFGRPVTALETTKAQPRRIGEDFFAKYCHGTGLDIGFGGDLLASNCDGWDFEHGDMQYLKKIPNRKYDFVYSGHTLEHLSDVDAALRNWWRVLKPNGYLILYLPDRDLYERKKELPSQRNTDHRHYFLLDRDESPDTIGILPQLKRSLSGYEIVSAQVCRAGYSVPDPLGCPVGEYSLEVVLRKNNPQPVKKF